MISPTPWEITGRWILDANGADVAEVVGAYNGPGEDRLTDEGPDNAKTIAAAPEVVAALFAIKTLMSGNVTSAIVSAVRETAADALQGINQ